MMQAAKPSRLVADPAEVYNHALRFLCTDQAIRRVFTPASGWGLIVAPPTMVLSAFSAELFLKCILILETNEAPANIHKLHMLYRQLSSDARQRIEQIWDEECRAKLDGIARLHGHPTDLPGALLTCSAAFEKLRYAYENQFNDVVYYVGDFPWILARYIAEIRPQWTPEEPPPIPRTS
jgi:hypothetical protein